MSSETLAQECIYSYGISVNKVGNFLENQLFQDLRDWFDTSIPLLPGMGCPPKDINSVTTTNEGHGHIEVCTLTTSSQLNIFLDWPFLQQLFKLESLVTIQKPDKSGMRLPMA